MSGDFAHRSHRGRYIKAPNAEEDDIFGRALALSGDWTHSAAILHLVRAHLASLTKGAANDPTDGEVAKAFTRAKAAAKKRRRDQENASGPALVPIVEAAKLLAQQK